MILYGGEILTLEPARPVVEAIAIRNGRISASGPREEVLALRGPDTRVIDLNGKVLLPSLKDHHLHVLNIGFAVLNRQKKESLFLDLSAAKSVEEVASRVAERAKSQPKGSWIFGTGWNQIRFGTQKLPTHKALSEAAPDHPVCLIRVDAHCAWVNAAAMHAAGIARETKEPRGGAIYRDLEGEPSGILLERAAELVLEKFPQPSNEIVTEAFRLGARTLAAQGITDVYDAGFLPFPGIVGMNVSLRRYFELLSSLDAKEPLPIRIHLMIPAPTALAEEVLRNPRSFNASERLRATHIKLFADGAFGSRGAALSRPFSDDSSTTGVLRMTADELKQWTERALAAGIDVATHAIGDAGIQRTLDAYEAVLQANPKISPRSLRIEHFSWASQSDIERAARLGVLLSIQPGFVYPGQDGHIMEDSRLGKDHEPSAYSWATLKRLGAILGGGSDDFSVPEHPLWNFYAAATRTNSAGQPHGGWRPAEKLSLETALRLFTDLHTQGGEVSAGHIVRGAAADCVILSANPMKVAAPEILKIKVHATLLGGRITYSDGTL